MEAEFDLALASFLFHVRIKLFDSVNNQNFCWEYNEQPLGTATVTLTVKDGLQLDASDLGLLSPESSTRTILVLRTEDHFMWIQNHTLEYNRNSSYYP